MPHLFLSSAMKEMNKRRSEMSRNNIYDANDGDFQQNVSDLMVGKSITKVEQLNDADAELTLSDGTVLLAEGNEGCGGCGNGWYDLKELNGCENVITRVEASNDGEIYNLFVYSENMKITCLSYEGDDNGYYGRGYTITARKSEDKE
jgi:hypothetical protein